MDSDSLSDVETDHEREVDSIVKIEVREEFSDEDDTPLHMLSMINEPKAKKKRVQRPLNPLIRPIIISSFTRPIRTSVIANAGSIQKVFFIKSFY